jgi:hypothetical protein
MASDVNAVVSFNVGGQTFTTLRETLLKEANSRLALVARGLLAAVRDPVTGAYVLDRDPKYFQLILNWLRDGWCLLPRTAEERRELIQEVRYYQASVGSTRRANYGAADALTHFRAVPFLSAVDHF